MKRKEFAVVLVTAPDSKTARKLAKAALKKRLAACVNVLAGMQSHYWWRGNIMASPEVLLVIKTRRSCLASLEKLVLAQHPYEVPEFIVLDVADGNRRYCAWLTESVSACDIVESALKNQRRRRTSH